MKCPKCGGPISKKDPFCENCGKRLKHPFRALLITSLVFVLALGVVITAFWFKGGSSPNEAKPAEKKESIAISKHEQNAAKAIEDKANHKQKQESSSIHDASKADEYIQGADTADTEQPKIEKQTMELKQKEDITDYINSAKAAVFTVTTPEMQGSGFLYNSNGIVVTNAHVIEGWTEATVHSSTGESYTGSVIGYSNKTDVAIIQVPELAGNEPFPIDRSSSVNIGDEIVALGSPLGKENTATMGYLTGKDRSFVIGTFSYDNLFQISAPTAPGSSGGPLISKNSKKIIAINSAQSTSNVSVGFSIPFSQVGGMIDGWINNPMDEKQLLAQFYGIDGEYVYGDDWAEEDGHFKDGDVSEDKDHYDYWEYPYDEYWDNNGEKAPVDQSKPDAGTPADQPQEKPSKPADQKTEQQPATDSTEQKPVEEPKKDDGSNNNPAQNNQDQKPAQTPTDGTGTQQEENTNIAS